MTPYHQIWMSGFASGVAISALLGMLGCVITLIVRKLRPPYEHPDFVRVLKGQVLWEHAQEWMEACRWDGIEAGMKSLRVSHHDEKGWLIEGWRNPLAKQGLPIW